MGAIIPLAIRLALDPDIHKGRAVGRMYALGSAGSILGTFLAGFWLIAALGTINTIWVIAAIMLLGAAFYLPKSAAVYIYSLIFTLLIITGVSSAQWAQQTGQNLRLRQIRPPEVLFENESQYCYIAVRQVTKHPDERQFIEDNLKNHSRLIMGEIRDLRLFYTKVYGAVTHLLAKDKTILSTLSIGGGGYVFPRYILDVWPDSRVDVVEIDPAVTDAAKIAFGLSEDSPINTFSLDGRNYIDGLLEKKRTGLSIPQYDFIYMDAFSDMAVPFQLTTRQFSEKIFAILSTDGVYMINMIDTPAIAKFAGSLIKTLKLSFPQVYVVKQTARNNLPTNFVVIAAKMPVNLDNLNADRHLARMHIEIFDENNLASFEKKSGVIVLDDDYAPVENFIAPAARGAAAIEMAEKFIEQAEILNAGGKWESALEKLRLAIKTCPSWTLKAYYLMSQVLAKHSRLPEAIDAINSALAQIDPNVNRINTASFHYNIGLMLNKLGDPNKAKSHLVEADKLLRQELVDDDGPAEIFWYLGSVQSAMGNIKQATDLFETAVKKDPDELAYRLSLAETLTRQKLYNEASKNLQESIDYMLDKNRKDDAEQLKELMRRLEIDTERSDDPASENNK
jgi:tetratricopeptide (TPR) repeat protein